jgi:hypothetical protein
MCQDFEFLVSLTLLYVCLAGLLHNLRVESDQFWSMFGDVPVERCASTNAVNLFLGRKAESSGDNTTAHRRVMCDVVNRTSYTQSSTSKYVRHVPLLSCR